MRALGFEMESLGLVRRPVLVAIPDLRGHRNHRGQAGDVRASRIAPTRGARQDAYHERQDDNDQHGQMRRHRWRRTASATVDIVPPGNA